MASDTVDLQIFLGRVGDAAPPDSHALPTLLGTRTRSEAESSVDESPFVNSDALPSYIAIANSEVIEIVRFPIAIKDIRPLVERLASNQLTMQMCVDWGERLFNFVFHRSIRDTFRHLLTQGSQVRVTIATSVPELVFVPWELLCDTCPGLLPRFLCYDQHVHLIRSLRLYNRSTVGEKTLGDGQELRILLVTADPGHDIDVLKEERMLRFVVDELPTLENVRISVLHEANVSTMRSRLLEFRPQIVHVACHGGYDPIQNLGCVSLVSAKNGKDVDNVNAYRFAALMNEPKSVQMVFVNTCYGAFQHTLTAFSGIAQCLHATGIDEVVALQFVLEDSTAHAIVLNFYKSLLRDGRSVEDAVTRVRRHLFINGHMIQETFGLTVYQGNGSYSWPRNIPAERIAEDSVRGFSEIQEFFDAQVKKEVMEKLSVEFERNRQALADLSAVTAEDLLLMHKVFDDIPFALEITREINAVGVSPHGFLRLARLAQSLALQRNESHLVAAAIVVKAKKDYERYAKRLGTAKSEMLPWDVFNVEMNQVVASAIKASGETQALFAIVDPKDEQITCVIRELSPASANDAPPIGLDSKWGRLCRSVSQNGCAFLLPGDARLKILAGGEQIAEFNGGSWRQANLRRMREAFIDLARHEGLTEKLCLSIMCKCLMASERRRGLSLIVQRTTQVKLHQGYFDVGARPDDMGLRDRPIFTIDDRGYLDKVAGDNSVVISASGVTIAINAALVYLEATEVVPIPGTGSRHLSAQKATKETDAIAFVVSESGPISIFKDGKRIHSFL